jgi:hypothetical protein
MQGETRVCILRDISFYGAKIIIMGTASLIEKKDIILTMDFEEPKKSYTLQGRFVRADTFEERKSLVALAISFEESTVPLGYKMRISNYINQQRFSLDQTSQEDRMSQEDKTNQAEQT